MNDSDRKLIIDRYLTNNVFNPNRFKSDLNNNSSIANLLFEITEFLNKINPSNAQRFYHVRRNLTEIPKCESCGAVPKFIKYSLGYRRFCSISCSMLNDKTKNKRTKTTLERHGVEHNFKSKECQQKRKKTWIKKYGVDNPSKTKEIKNKIAKIYNDKYYDDVILKSNYFKPMFSKDEWCGNSKIEYEFECKKCGTIFKHSLYNGFSSTRCTVCMPIHHVSQAHKEIEEYLKSLGIENIVMNTKKIIKPLELDIYLPDHKLAIEYNGLYWHSSSSVEDDNEAKKRHLIKTEMAEGLGLQLLHIFENEWMDFVKQDIWKSILKSKVGKNNKLMARKCNVKVLTSKEKKDFLNENHLQGDTNSSINLGLIDKGNELVSVITFGKPRYNKNFEWEIVRFANKKYTNVIGGFSKLLSYFVKNNNPKNIITYADRRYSNGNMYKQAMFEEKENSQACYFYFKNNDYKLCHRSVFQKHKLKDLLEQFDETLSESQNMYNNDYRRIWDCGNKVFVKSNHLTKTK